MPEIRGIEIDRIGKTPERIRDRGRVRPRIGGEFVVVPDPEAPADEKQQQLPVANLAASFQSAVVEALVDKTIAAAEEHHATEIFVAGGVSANRPLR